MRVCEKCTARIECNRKVLLGVVVPLFHLHQLKVAARSVHLVQAPQSLEMQCTSMRVVWYMVALQCKPAIHCNKQLNTSPANRCCNAIHAALKRTTRYGGTSYISSMQQLNASPQPNPPKCNAHAPTRADKPGIHRQS